MQIPILRAGEEAPIEGPAYVLGRQGAYLRKTTPLFESLLKAGTLADLPEVEERISWRGPKIPYKLILEALSFFRSVLEAHASEAIVLLTLEDGKWGILAPEQTVGAAHLDYKTDPEIARKRPVGTIHSHCDMGAFFSATDEKDVEDFDGVHLVLGRISLPVPEIAASVTVNGRSVPLALSEVIQGLPEAAKAPKDHPWLAKVKKGVAATLWGDDDELWRASRTHREPGYEPHPGAGAPGIARKNGKASGDDALETLESLIRKVSPEDREAVLEELLAGMEERGEISELAADQIRDDPEEAARLWTESY